MIVPGAVILGSVVDFAVGWFFFNLIAIVWTLFPSFFAFALMGGGAPDTYQAYWTWRFIPFTFIMLVLQLSTVMGIGLVLSALSAQYRDIRFVTPVLIQFGLFVTPIMWPVTRLLKSGLLENYGQIFLYINPMAGVIETYRSLLAESSYIPYKMLAANFCVAFALLAFGIWFFRKREKRLVDFL
jgi:lipopolysaccharide transport system permease protein